MWPQIVDSLKHLAKALFKPTTVASVDGRVVTVRLPSNMPVKRAEDQSAALQSAIEAVCGGAWRVTFVQGDPTSPGGMQRPVVEEEPTKPSIVEEVRNDPYAPVDPDELIDASGEPDPHEELLRAEFPGGRFLDPAAADDTPPRGKK